VIKKGESISCCLCKKEIYRAREDIIENASMKSAYLESMDSSPLNKFSKMACPNCWVMFRSISTETKKTIL